MAQTSLMRAFEVLKEVRALLATLAPAERWLFAKELRQSLKDDCPTSCGAGVGARRS